MKQSTSKDIERVRQQIIDQYPNKSISNFGLIYVKDRWIMGLVIEGIRYVGEANTPYDALFALQTDLERYEQYTEKLGELERKLKGEDDDNNPDRNSADSNAVSS